MEKRVNPELRQVLSTLPPVTYTRASLPEIRQKDRAIFAALQASTPPDERVEVAERWVPGPAGAPDVRVKIYRPKAQTGVLPGVFFIHGGGHVGGAVESCDARCVSRAIEINCVVVSVDYRLAPEHPFPADLEDCYAALKWFSENAPALNVDASRIAVTGSSAGGGLTIALTFLTRDRGGPAIAFQMPLYPMIDDRNVTKSSLEITDDRVWNRTNNLFSWDMYLGEARQDVSPYAAPTRATDLSGLPPCYICVGDLDPFRDETIEYVARLTQTGTPVEFHLYPGCFHGHEVFVPSAEISRRTTHEYLLALKNALHKAE